MSCIQSLQQPNRYIDEKTNPDESPQYLPQQHPLSCQITEFLLCPGICLVSAMDCGCPFLQSKNPTSPLPAPIYKAIDLSKNNRILYIRQNQKASNGFIIPTSFYALIHHNGDIKNIKWQCVVNIIELYRYRYMYIQEDTSIGNAMNCSAVGGTDTKRDNNRTSKQMPYGHWKRDKY